MTELIIDLRYECAVRSTFDEHGTRVQRCVPEVLVMEDADHGIVRRTVDNFSIISEIANLCDGIPGQILDARIIATTNAARLDIDEALVRPGRLAHAVTFTLLEPQHAQRIYDRLTGNTGRVRFREHCSLAQVYQAARGTKNQARSGVREPKTGFIQAMF